MSVVKVVHGEELFPFVVGLGSVDGCVCVDEEYIFFVVLAVFEEEG